MTFAFIVFQAEINAQKRLALRWHFHGKFSQVYDGFQLCFLLIEQENCRKMKSPKFSILKEWVTSFDSILDILTTRTKYIIGVLKSTTAIPTKQHVVDWQPTNSYYLGYLKKYEILFINRHFGMYDVGNVNPKIYI